MQFLAVILMFWLATAPFPALAADPSQVFSTILGEIGRQIEHQQREQQIKRLRPHWEACARGDTAACDRAARFPGLNAQGRAEIERMRQAAERHQAFVRDFQACQRMDGAACQAALAYPPLSDTDRARLMDWKRNADQHQDALADFRRNQRACYAGSVAACSAAIDAHQLDPGALPALEQQRTRLQSAEQQRQAAERQRQADLAEFQQDRRNCSAGLIAACTAAIANSQAGVSERRQLEIQRDRLQRAEQQRHAVEQQRLAAIREYERLRTDCTEGKRTACARAVTHAQARSPDLAVLKQRDRELAPFTERLSNILSGVNLANVARGGPTTLVLSAVLGLLALAGAGFGTVYVVRHRASAPPDDREPPSLAPQQSLEQPSEPTTAANFPLTGHMPTDVRSALATYT
jgi:hypothetical protein